LELAQVRYTDCSSAYSRNLKAKNDHYRHRNGNQTIIKKANRELQR